MLATRDEIIRYIPQRPPMVMIHHLIEASDAHAVTELDVDDGNLFVENGYLSEPGMVENIAQTAAAQVGYHCASKNIAVPIGYIASVRGLKIAKLPVVSTRVRTTVRVTNQVLDVTVIKGEISQDGHLCCACEMRIFVKTQL
jgi:3-hydroxyacyl-[acyl-carrier-protein] dehydratase